MEKYDVVRVRCTHLLEDPYMLFEEGGVYEFEKYSYGRRKVYIYRVKTRVYTFLVAFCNRAHMNALEGGVFSKYYIFDDFFVELKVK